MSGSSIAPVALRNVANSACAVATVSRTEITVPLGGRAFPGFELRCVISKRDELAANLASWNKPIRWIRTQGPTPGSCPRPQRGTASSGTLTSEDQGLRQGHPGFTASGWRLQEVVAPACTWRSRRHAAESLTSACSSHGIFAFQRHASCLSWPRALRSSSRRSRMTNDQDRPASQSEAGPVRPPVAGQADSNDATPDSQAMSRLSTGRQVSCWS